MTLAVNPSAEASNTALNATFTSAGTVDTCYRLFQKSIHPSVPYVEEKWVGEPNGFAGALYTD